MKIEWYMLVYIFVHLSTVCDSCLPGSGGRNRGASGSGQQRSFSSSSSDGNGYRSRYKKQRLGRIHQLNSGSEAMAVTTNLRLFQGDRVYGKLLVPWSAPRPPSASASGEDDSTAVPLDLTITASWTNRHYTSPMWMYLRKGQLPSKEDYDKTSISFVSRRFSRIRVDDAPAGPYFLMLEGLSDLRNVTLSVMLTPAASIRAKNRPWNQVP